MFGKKQDVVVPLRDFRCGVCGIDYFDQSQFERHVGSAHPRPEIPKTEKQLRLLGFENKA